MTEPRSANPRPALLTRSDWDQALADGVLTFGDVVERLRRIAVHEFGEEGAAGYDDQGFLISLTAEGLRMDSGETIRVHANDHPPPHVHIQRPGKHDIKINLETGDAMGDLPRDVRTKQLKGFRAAINENFEQLGAWWEKNHGTPVVPSHESSSAI